MCGLSPFVEAVARRGNGVFYIAENQSGLSLDAELKGKIQDDRLVFGAATIYCPTVGPAVLARLSSTIMLVEVMYSRYGLCPLKEIPFAGGVRTFEAAFTQHTPRSIGNNSKPYRLHGLSHKRAKTKSIGGVFD